MGTTSGIEDEAWTLYVCAWLADYQSMLADTGARIPSLIPLLRAVSSSEHYLAVFRLVGQVADIERMLLAGGQTTLTRRIFLTL